MKFSPARASRIALIALAAFALSPCRAADPPLRLAVVNTPKASGLIDALVAQYQSASGRRVEVRAGEDVFERARDGKADLVIAHLGKPGMEAFVRDGYGAWPKTVFSNQAAIIGPKSDPAGIRGLNDATEAFRRIARSKSPFVANRLAGVDYLTALLWEGAGRPDKTGWYIDEGVGKGRAIRLAGSKRGYVIFGAIPFLRVRDKQGSELELLVTGDPLLQRVMASVVVRRDKLAGVDQVGAEAFQSWLLTPAVQAGMARYVTPGASAQLWWPAARHNANDMLDE